MKGPQLSLSGEMRRGTRMKSRMVTGVAIVVVLGVAGVCVECKVKVRVDSRCEILIGGQHQFSCKILEQPQIADLKRIALFLSSRLAVTTLT